VRYLATRFSAKEAFSKAVGLGMRMPMTWKLCEVGKLPSGKPVIVLHGVLKDWCEARGSRPRSPSPTKPTTRPASWSWKNERQPPDMSEHAPVILDVAGLALTKADRRRLAHPLVGGMILFGRNWQRPRAAVRLCAEIKAVRDDLLICVDHEGGRVQRFRTDGFTHLPPMRALGELWMKDALAATNAATAAATCWAPSCAPAASTSASRRCWTSIGARAA
jgi:hypothetical protein